MNAQAQLLFGDDSLDGRVLRALRLFPRGLLAADLAWLFRVSPTEISGVLCDLANRGEASPVEGVWTANF